MFLSCALCNGEIGAQLCVFNFHLLTDFMLCYYFVKLFEKKQGLCYVINCVSSDGQVELTNLELQHLVFVQLCNFPAKTNLDNSKAIIVSSDALESF